MAEFDSMGRQVPDPTPVEVPAELRRPLSLQDEIRRFVRSELSQVASRQGVESFEEADDFDLPDDDTDLEFDGSKYEVMEMVPVLAEVDADPPGSARKAPAPATNAVNAGTIEASAGQGDEGAPPSPPPS